MLGLCLCMLTLSFLVKTCDSAGRAIRELFAYLGRNSLSIVIFSPRLHAPVQAAGPGAGL